MTDSSQAILTGSGTKNPKLEYLPEEYEFKEDINVFASGKNVFLFQERLLEKQQKKEK